MEDRQSSNISYSPLSAPVDEIASLPNDLHRSGVLSDRVVRAIHKHAVDRNIADSVETGSGKSTLLLSWISAHHRVFTYGEPAACGSLESVQKSSLFNPAGNVEFILGPSQRTLPCFTFDRPLQLVFIDGPHGFPFPQLEYYFLYPHLAEGGLFILDDIHIPTIDGLMQFLRVPRGED